MLTIKRLFLIAFVPLYLYLATDVQAQLKINEFSSGGSDDWVEIYNTATVSADLSIYRLRDSTTSNKKDMSGSLAPGGFLSFSFGNDLNNSGDNVKLIQFSGDQETTIDQVSYGEAGGICASDASQSIGRKPDGTGSFVKFSSATKDSSNTASEVSCPTPTPTQTPATTPNPTPVPTPTPTVTPVKTATPTPKATPKKTPTPSPSPTPEDEVDEVLSAKDEATPTPSPTVQVKGDTTQNRQIPPFAIIFIIGGIGLTIFGALSFFKQARIAYNGTSAEPPKNTKLY